MNSDIRLSVGFWSHPKTRKMVKRLGLEGVRSLQILWLWAAQNRPDGNLSGLDWEDIEMAADWQGEERAFFEHCLGVWIDEAENGYVLHDWTEHNSWAADAEERGDKARFARLATVNRQEYEKLKAQGVNAISREDYEKLTAAKRKPDGRPTVVDETPTPSPSPSPEENKSTPNGVLVAATAATPTPPPCPHTDIIAAYHELLPELPAVKTWEGQRQKHLQARWRERWKAGKYRTQGEGVAYWHRLFAHVSANCDWLMGRISAKDGKSFRASLAWMVMPENFAKLIEGKYDR